MDRENLKGKLKTALICLAIFLVIAIPTAIIAQHLIESLPVEVTVKGYTLTISDPQDGTIFDTYTFAGTLTLDGTPVEGKTVTLYLDDTPTSLTDMTATDGSYSISMIPNEIGLGAGTYTFKTVAEV